MIRHLRGARASHRSQMLTFPSIYRVTQPKPSPCPTEEKSSRSKIDRKTLQSLTTELTKMTKSKPNPSAKLQGLQTSNVVDRAQLPHLHSTVATVAYEYKELRDAEKNIRILTLENGHYDHPLRATISEASLADAPQYGALSYCWGSSEKPYTIEVRDKQREPLQPLSSPRTLAITESLSLALRRLRQPSAHIRLWADAVCINQKDNAERACQVR